MMTQIMWCGWAAAVEQMRRGSETFVLQVMRILIPAMVVTALILMVMSGICFDLNLVTIWQTVFENMCISFLEKNPVTSTHEHEHKCNAIVGAKNVLPLKVGKD